MMMDMEQEIARLCATTEGFDLAFIDAMIPHHQMRGHDGQMATMRAEHPELQVTGANDGRRPAARDRADAGVACGLVRSGHPGVLTRILAVVSERRPVMRRVTGDARLWIVVSVGVVIVLVGMPAARHSRPRGCRSDTDALPRGRSGWESDSARDGACALSAA